MVHTIAKWFFRIILSPYVHRVTGLENVPKDRNFIIAANHASYIDHIIISSQLLCYLNKKIHFLAKKEHFNSWSKKKFHTWADAIPVDRQKGGKDALMWAIGALKKGKIISIHPEGTRTLTVTILRAKTGMARLTVNSKVPVQPVGLRGTFKMLPKGKYSPRVTRAEMHIGKLMYFDQYYGKENDKRTLRTVTTKIMKEIARLAGQEYDFD
ncbi:1-acyl-sn-glycerol-3-phosphate acyltransferase [Candidatus Woesearchaeota archaeon]|nr:1-acyl-sn-glycerol-3-phosphate acyltransferase [Candidatus Woesearchaeota archaeon]